jgi:branched-chain amino acid aminotransferase
MIDDSREVPMGTHDALPDDRNADVQISINGEFFHRSEAKISVFDSGYLVGDGIWEGIRLHNGTFAFLKEHLDRLFQGLQAVGIDLGMTRDELVSALYATTDRNDMYDDVHVRLMVTRGIKKTPSQHPDLTISGPNVVIIAEHKVANTVVASEGISLFTATIRRPPPDTLDQKLNSHSKLHEVIALIQATHAGADEALMLDPTGAVATCNATNFFIVTDGVVMTSTGHYNLHGITRAKVIEVAQAAEIPVEQRDFSLVDVYSADEAFVTGTFGALTPVHTIDGRAIGDGGRTMTNALQSLYAIAVERNVKDFAR